MNIEENFRNVGPPDADRLRDAASQVLGRIPVAIRPAWTAGVLEAAESLIGRPTMTTELISIGRTQERWPSAVDVFRTIRHSTRQAERDSSSGAAPIELYVLENAAKLIANAGGQRFDDDIGVAFIYLVVQLSLERSDPETQAAIWTHITTYPDEPRTGPA